MPISIAGIPNCTPDSFSDGREDLAPAGLIERAQKLVDEGADILDIGGDSTRPGSTCVGVEEEWRRISPVLAKIGHQIPCSVDTHHVEVARRAIEHGAAFINDISGAHSDEMIHLLTSTGASYIFMYNAHGAPHRFGQGLELGDAFSIISEWIVQRSHQLRESGLPRGRLIADPGMGAFISRDPRVSLEILNRFHELPRATAGLLLGCSRKGFLAMADDKGPQCRDERSCKAAALAVTAIPTEVQVYVRVHNVALQREVLQRWPSMSETERRP